MKRIILTASVLLMLTGCGGDSPDLSQRASEHYSGADDITVSADIRADYGTEIYDFTVECSVTPDGSTVTIIEPEAVAGLTAKVSSDGSELIWDSTAIYLSREDDPILSPAGAIPGMVSQLRSGYCVGEVLCLYRDIKALRLDYQLADSVWCTLWLDRDSLELLHGELGTGDSTVIFCDINSLDME